MQKYRNFSMCVMKFHFVVYSRGAQRVVCAFRGTLCFSTVIGQFNYVETDVGGDIILKCSVFAHGARKYYYTCANTNFAYDGRIPFNRGCKMTAIKN